MYRTRLSGQWVALRGAPEGLFEPCGACVERAAMAVLLDQPFGVVANDEGADGVADLVDGLEDACMHDLLLQRSEQALDHSIRFRLPDEGVAWRHAPEPDLLLEVVGHEVAAVVVAEREAAGGAGGELTELLADGHADGLGGLVAGAGLCHVPAQQLGVPVLGDAEQPHLAVPDGGDPGGVGGPHHVRRRGDDVTVVRRLALLAGAVRRQQGVLAHQPQGALARHPDAVAHAQAGPDLAVPLAGPGRAREVGSDRRQQILVGDGWPWAAARRARPGPGIVRRACLTHGVERGPGHLPDAADAGDPVAAAGGRGGRVRHHRDLRRAKGPGRSILARSSSTAMVSSPMRCRAAASWPSVGSASRSFSAPSNAASALWRHCSSLNTGKPSSRESSSAASPRISRSTTSRLRPALQRWPGASGPNAVRPPAGRAPRPGDSVDRLRPPSLTSGPIAASLHSFSSMLLFTMPVSRRTNGCPGKPGAAQEVVVSDAGSASQRVGS